MTRMITFPEVLDSSGNWLFQMDGYTAEKNSSGGTGSGAPSSNSFQVEKGSSYITTSGRPVSKNESSALQMRYAQSISNHYYMTAYCGWAPYNSANASDIRHSPLYDGICNKLSFSWKKYDDAANSGHSNNRYRLRKVGMAFRNDSGSGYLKDLSVSGGNSGNLFNFNAPGTSSGTCEMTVPANARPFGMYFQLETEGSGARYPSGSYIKIWNLKFHSSKSDEALMMPYDSYSSASPPANRPIWTKD